MSMVTLAAVLVWIGCGTDATHKNGLHALEVDTERGTMRVVKSYPISQAIYQAWSNDGKIMYTAQAGGVGAYSVNGTTLQNLGFCACGGTPCHIAVMPKGNAVVWADYGNGRAGSIALEGGAFASDIQGNLTKAHGKGSHCHQAYPLPDGESFCVVDLGLDTLTCYPAGKVYHTKPVGAGPRHLVMTRKGDMAFVLSELGNWLTAYRYEADTGFVQLDALSTIPNGKGAPNNKDYASAIRFTPDGKRLVISNRGEETLVVYDFAKDTGKLTEVSRTKLKGSWPRDFVFITPKHVIVTMQRTGELNLLEYDAVTGNFRIVGNVSGFYDPVSVLPAWSNNRVK